jgi:tRNA 2-thiouridine synthesizing protein A
VTERPRGVQGGSGEGVEPAIAAAPSAGFDREWDAGSLGCGELVMDLRARLGAMQPGQVLKLTARDSGAPEDLPAWCRQTGNRLVGMDAPCYWILRKQ